MMVETEVMVEDGTVLLEKKQDVEQSSKEVGRRSDSEFEACVGLSRKWDAREAGREVAQTAIKGLSRPPDFFLLFSTIHYEKHGGFQEFLNGVWEVLPEGTPLIGGTVVGFTIPQGCYMRGAVSLAVSYQNMDVAIGIGHNTKRNPKKAAEECISSIKKELHDSNYPSKFLYCFISSSLVMEIPFVGRKKILKNKAVGSAITSLLNFTHYFQKGLGREDEVLNRIVKDFPDYSIIGGSSFDNMDFITNYQFYNNECTTNSVVVLSINTDMKVCTVFDHGMKKTNKTLNVTKLDKTKHVIKEINYKPAVEEFLRILDWPVDFLDEKKVYTTVPYYPLGFDKGKYVVPAVTPYFYGNCILTSYPVVDKNIFILTGSGKTMIDSLKNSLEKSTVTEPKLGIFSECATRVFSLGSNVYKEQQYLKSFFGDIPFLVLHMGGECSYTSDKIEIYGNELICSSLFS
ncbi:MAG: FIST N-terminal domain-containing protein [Candidatus Thermoplasmatota archaeon]